MLRRSLLEQGFEQNPMFTDHRSHEIRGQGWSNTAHAALAMILMVFSVSCSTPRPLDPPVLEEDTLMEDTTVVAMEKLPQPLEPKIQGQIFIGPSLASGLPEGGAVYVLVKGSREASGLPLAAVRAEGDPEDGFVFSIGPGDIISSSHDWNLPVFLSARWDQDGNARNEQPGDLVSKLRVRARPGEVVELVLDERLPETDPLKIPATLSRNTVRLYKSGRSFKSIKEAVSHAEQEDIVMIGPGVYDEEEIDAKGKNLSFIGAGRTRSKIISSDLYSVIFGFYGVWDRRLRRSVPVNYSSIVIRGLYLGHKVNPKEACVNGVVSFSGINASRIEILDNEIEGSGVFGIELNTASISSLKIEDNVIRDNQKSGIALYYAEITNIGISGNTIRNNGEAAFMAMHSTLNNVSASGNRSKHNRAGITKITDWRNNQPRTSARKMQQISRSFSR